jgi:hypothetical protein
MMINCDCGCVVISGAARGSVACLQFKNIASGNKNMAQDILNM